MRRIIFRLFKRLRSGTGAKRIKRKVRWVSRRKTSVRWVRQAKAKVRGTFALPNAQAREGLGRCPSEAGKRSAGIVPANARARKGSGRYPSGAGTAKRRGGAQEGEPRALMPAIPGVHPSDRLRRSNFAPGKIVERSRIVGAKKAPFTEPRMQKRSDPRTCAAGKRVKKGHEWPFLISC